MKTNTFYKPKNEYNELLASIPYVNSEDKILEEKINIETTERTEADNAIRTDVNAALSQLTSDYIAADNKLHTKIDTLNTIKVITISDADSIDEYFAKRWDSFKSENIEEEVEKLKIELSQSIYLIKGKDDETTWEEYVCRSFSEVTTNRESIDMIRLGAVDSILARLNSYGSVKLVHNVYEDFVKWEGDADEYWAQYHVTKFDNEGKEIKVPVKGLAVAPCSLKAFADSDNEIKIRLTAEEEARKISDTDLDTRIQYLEKEIGGSQSNIENEVEIHDSRIDLIEAAIGMNHQHCDNCGCEHDSCSSHDSCSCSDATNKCTIYCRLNDAEDDLQEHMDELQRHDTRIEGLEERADEHEEKIEELVNRVDKADGNIEINANHIVLVEENLNKEIERSINKDNELEASIESETNERESADANIWIEIGESANPSEGTIWSEIKHIHDEIGNQDAPFEDSIWQRINKNKTELDNEISRSNTTDKEHSEHISNLETDVEKIKIEIGTKESTDINIWHSIHTEIKDRASADTVLSNDIADALVSAKIYADELKTVTLSEAATDAEKKAATAEANAISSAAADASEKVEKAKEETINHAENFTNNAISEVTKTLRAEISDTEGTCKEYTDSVTGLKLNEAKDYANNAKNAAIAEATATAANDATTKANAAETAAITTATENAKQYIDDEVEKLKDLCNNYTDNEITDLSSTLSANITTAKEEVINTAKADATTKKQEAIDETNENIALVKAELVSAINSKVSNDVFESYSQSIESILETKASSNDLARTDNKLTTVEKDLEDISHELHHLTSQTQFAVRTSIPGAGAKVIQFYNLIGPDSNEWDLVRITSVVANNEIIYPEIEYSGELTGEKDDERKIEITFEHGGVESLPVILIVSAFKASEYRIIEID